MKGWMKLILFPFLFVIGFFVAYDALLDHPAWSAEKYYCDSSVTAALTKSWSEPDYTMGSDGYYCQQENKKRVAGAMFLSFVISAIIGGIIIYFSKEKGDSGE